MMIIVIMKNNTAKTPGALSKLPQYYGAVPYHTAILLSFLGSMGFSFLGFGNDDDDVIHSTLPRFLC